MAGVSQDSLADFANHNREPASPGVEIIDTGRFAWSATWPHGPCSPAPDAAEAAVMVLPVEAGIESGAQGRGGGPGGVGRTHVGADPEQVRFRDCRLAPVLSGPGDRLSGVPLREVSHRNHAHQLSAFDHGQVAEPAVEHGL